jgi:hypothetical protein
MHTGRPVALTVRAGVCLLFALALAPAPAAAKEEPGVPDKALQKAIDAAIAKGADYLRSIQQQSGAIGSVVHRGAAGSHFGIGSTALGGLALLAAGEKKGDDAVDRAMEYCRDKDKFMAGGGSRTTYDTGTLLMFVAAYYHGEGEVKKGRPRKTVTAKDRGNPCHFPEDVRAWVREMAMWLISSQETSGGFGYPKPREDLSNTQYALLGLRAARDCGGTVPGRVFKIVAQHLIAIQEQDGPKVMRTMGGEKKGDRVYRIDGGDRARGWSYMTSPFLATGSMTTSGISCLAICHDALTNPRRLPIYTPKLSAQLHRSVQDGFAWLDVNFTVQRNPPASAPAWYYLYGLERAAILAGRVLIGQHDWYLTGARYLVGQQKGDGRWATGMLGGKDFEASDALDTAWAILFLKKATRPATPIQGPVVTPTNGGK